MKEIWKTIENYPEYQVSNLGRIKSLKYGKERIMKQGINKHGYFQVSLCREEKKGKTFRVHKLVAQTFLPNPENYPCVNHKDEVKTNNCVDNIEWCTQKYNNNYGTHNERMSKTKKGKKHTQEHIKKCAKAHHKPIACYNKNGDLVALYTSATQASELLNIYYNNIRRCCRGELKSCGGYIFKYINKAG